MKGLTGKRLLLFGAIIVCAVVVTGISAYMLLHKRTDPVPESIKKSVLFPVYYPTQLPDGYQIESSSFQANSNVLLYSIGKAGAQPIAVTVQSKPENFDFDNFHLKQMRSSREVLTGSGKAVIGLFGDKPTGSLVTADTWVLVSANPQLPADQLEALMKSFTKPTD